MTEDKIIELKDLYDTLIELGVIFYYGSESIAHGEITNIEFNEDDTVDIEINDFERYKIDIEDFAENHSKEGNNYHTWSLSRNFESILNDLI